MTPPISLRALLEAEAPGRVPTWFLLNACNDRDKNDPATGVGQVIPNLARDLRDARNAVRPLAEALQEAIAALEDVGRGSHAGPTDHSSCPRCAAYAALAKIRERIAP